MPTFFGADPGGASKKKFGVAVIDATPRIIDSSRKDSVQAVLDWFCFIAKEYNLSPEAIGIDAPLTWNTMACGWRMQDHHVGKTYQVMSPNSLPGSVIFQGPTLALEIKKIWPDIKVSEVHPSATFNFLQTHKRPILLPLSTNKDIRDAEIAAFVAYAGYTGLPNWTNLNTIKVLKQQLVPFGKVDYYFPI